MTQRDEHLWEEEVVEAFLDLDRSGRDYAELEISPGNVVCDVRMVTPHPDKKYDLTWNLEGLETRVVPFTDGAGRTIGWTALARLPWTGFRTLPSAARIALPPRPGDSWRFNVFRVERPGGKEHPDEGRHRGGVVGSALAELPRAGVVPRPRLRRAVTTAVSAAASVTIREMASARRRGRAPALARERLEPDRSRLALPARGEPRTVRGGGA